MISSQEHHLPSAESAQLSASRSFSKPWHKVLISARVSHCGADAPVRARQSRGLSPHNHQTALYGRR